MIQGLSVTLQELDQHRTLIAICVPMIGGALAASSSVLVPRGKAKGLMTGTYLRLASLGIACLLFACIAAILGAHLTAITPLLLPGIVLTVIMGIFTPEVMRQYQHFEIRKLAAEIFRRM
jgi:predicted membrane channel-forming protein YqfA (hemolysin III family)